MALSNWNRYLETKLAAKLNGAENRLLDAIARETLGWNRLAVVMGGRQLQERAGIDRHSFIRARQRLIDTGLIDYQPGKAGRGGVRGTYQVRLGESKSVNPHSLDDGGKSVDSHSLDTPSKSADQHQQRVSGSTHLRVKGKKNTGTATAKHAHGDSVKKRATNQELVGRVIENYSAKGGNLEREGWRAMLARHVTQLLKADTDADLIVTAAGVLARESDAYPGNLTKLVKQIQAEGMPCKHRGDLRGLSKALLLECGCAACLDRIAHCEAHGLDTVFLEPLLV